MTTNAFAIYPSLADKPVIVSGGASGIGAGIVEAFAAQGAKVGFVDIDATAGQALATRLNGEGRTARFLACDVTDTLAYKAAIETFATEHGPALVLVNNAGHDQRHDWSEVTPDYWDDRMAVNLKHAFFASQAVAPGMIAAGGGAIINLGSISWMVMTPKIPVYETAKAALHGMTRALARELGPHHIRVNLIAPGAIITERQLKLWMSPDYEAELDAVQALPGRLHPADVARMALFLAAEDSKMISAQAFLVDGGWAHG